ncbi:hypothetical protein B0O99DRAFT_602542 [Bisporella sp. PMI_857]|nr:hypothetical protein B0O99DRAFT_602542 [Bisporella sp. PMI_857]
MADFTTTFQDIASETVLTGRREDICTVDGTASFLALAVKLGVPVLARKQLGTGQGRSAGGGLSFAVSITSATFKLEKGLGWANETPLDWFDRVATQSSQLDTVFIKNLVNKRILIPRHLRLQDDGKHDGQILLAMATEMRVLAHKEVRKSANIVTLVAISWTVRETSGRFWPELLLEGAAHGNLSHYLQASPDLNFRSKSLILMDISAGLAFLHENGIVHCDVKPGNMLVCDSPERRAVGSIGIAPVIVKLCDFGCSIILSDYPESHRFSITVGTPGWMAPEIEHGLPIKPPMLFKTDIYSLGLVAATIFTGVRPSPSITHRNPGSEVVPSPTDNSQALVNLLEPNEGVSSKGRKREYSDLAEDEDMPYLQDINIGMTKRRGESCRWMDRHSRSSSDLNASDFTSPLGTNSSRSSAHVGGQFALLQMVTSCTIQQRPSDRREARYIYGLCQDSLSREGRIANIDILNSVLPTCSDQTKALTARLQPNDARVPDFAFESTLRTAMIPSQCRMEVIRDLRRRVANNSSDAGHCALQLAALIANGYLGCDRQLLEIEVEKYLTSAVASGNRLALSVAINIFNAMGREVPLNMRRQVQGWFEDRSFRLQVVNDIKSLFFPLSLDPILGRPSVWSIGRFSLARRYDIQGSHVGFRTWEREFRWEFNNFLSSSEYHQLLSVIPISLFGTDDIDWPEPDILEFANSMVTKYIYTSALSFGKMDLHERDLFMAEILENEIINDPTRVGLTLLQLAVCRGDEAAAAMLLDVLGADIDAYGTTAHLTPLWIACFLGNIDMASLLLAHSADLTCTDSMQGLTVLHLLSQFRTKDGVEGIGYEALAAGVDIDAKSKKDITPLLASMLVFDFSSGAALEFLLENGADPLIFTMAATEENAIPVSPVTLCVRNLDPDLLEQLLVAAPVRPIVDGLAREIMASRLQDIGFQVMRSQTTFGTMLEAGSRYRTGLRRTLWAVSGLEYTELFRTSPAYQPLQYSFAIDRTDLLEHLLDINPSAPLVCVDETGQQASMLHESAMRQNPRAINVALRHGADVQQLVGTALCGDSLSWIVREVPSMLPVTLDYLDRQTLTSRHGKSVKEILETPMVDCAGIFDCILLHGTSQDLDIAEAIRAKYDLNHDAVQPFPPNTTTLMGALVLWTQSYGVDKLAQFRYLLSLNPKPRLILPCGVNLFSLAATVSSCTMLFEQLELFRMLLAAYPEVENLTLGRRQLLPALHVLASGTHIEVLQLLREHVELKHPGKKIPYNYAHLRNEIPEGPVLLTALDCCRFGITVPDFDKNANLNLGVGREKEDILKMNAFEKSEERGQRQRIYQYLRGQGAVHGWELDGYFIR